MRQNVSVSSQAFSNLPHLSRDRTPRRFRTNFRKKHAIFEVVSEKFLSGYRLNSCNVVAPPSIFRVSNYDVLWLNQDDACSGPLLSSRDMQMCDGAESLIRSHSEFSSWNASQKPGTVFPVDDRIGIRPPRVKQSPFERKP